MPAHHPPRLRWVQISKMKVSKNISKGRQINDLNELVRLALAKQSVVVQRGTWFQVRPAAFLVHWSICQLVRVKLFYSIKNEVKNNRQ